MLQRRTSTGGVVYYASPQLEAIGVPHAFSTRIGGVSPAPFDTLNLGNPSGTNLQDDREHIARNYARLHAAIGCASRKRCWVRQAHGNVVVGVDRAGDFACGLDADALVTSDPQALLAVRVADCVPILLSRGDGRAVAAVHAGWRGVLAGIVDSAVRTLAENDPNGLTAAIGPCIGFEAFDVGLEVLADFERAFGPGSRVLRRANQTGYVDLRAAVRVQLIGAGVPADRIDLSDRCTFRDADEFFSHRRDRGVTGRMAAVIGPADP